MILLRKKFQKSKILCSFFCVFIFLFSVSFSCFAVETWKTVDTFQIGNLSYSYKGSDISIRVKPDNSTNIYNNGSQVDLYFPYCTTNSWVSGNSYRLQFSVGEITSLTNCVFDIYLSNSLDDISNATHLFDSSKSSVSLLQGGIDVNFNYSGQSYLLFIITISSGSLLNISECYVNAYNSNAVAESQNQQIIDGQNEQNSKLDEQNSKLFDNSETFSVPEVDISSQLNDFNIKSDEVKSWSSAILGNLKLMNGIKAFSTFFNAIWDSIVSDSSLQSLASLAYLTVTVSVILLIVGFIKERARK
jgi:hypothetical protein